MALKKLLRFAAGGLIVVFAFLLYGEMTMQKKIVTYNNALAENDYQTAAELNTEHGEFAKAFQLHQQGSYQEARVIYASLSDAANPEIREAALYNSGNTYLQQALKVDMEKEADVAFPLLELAKVSYRDLLAQNENNWESKYNLERVLQLSPDSRALPNVEIPGRQNPNRTVISIDPEDSLP